MSEYVDREAFIAQKRELYCKDCDRRKGMKNGKYRILYDIGDVPCRACGIEDVLSDVEDFPAADVQPVKHGRWEERDCGFDVECKCSVCGYKDFILTKHDRYWFNRNYCPNCGADMRETNDEKA